MTSVFISFNGFTNIFKKQNVFAVIGCAGVVSSYRFFSFRGKHRYLHVPDMGLLYTSGVPATMPTARKATIKLFIKNRVIPTVIIIRFYAAKLLAATGEGYTICCRGCNYCFKAENQSIKNSTGKTGAMYFTLRREPCVLSPS